MLQPLIDQLLSGDRRALARLITLIEGGEAARVLELVHPRTGSAYTIGVTGPPGAGKSTLADGLTALYRKEGLTVGILALDPTSPFTGGAVLGDRIRMQRHYLDQGVFIRSMASRGQAGGLSRMTRGALKLLDASGKDLLLVETVGVGQTELEIMSTADTVVVVLMPEAGDAVQTLKAGLLEIADIFVVNKADREGSDRLFNELEAMLNLVERPLHREPVEPAWWRPPVLRTQAHKEEGIQELHQAIQRHRHALEEASHLQEKRRHHRRRDFFKAIEEALGDRLRELVHQQGDFASVMARVEEGEEDPHAAASHLLNSHALLKQWLARAEESKSL